MRQYGWLIFIIMIALIGMISIQAYFSYNDFLAKRSDFEIDVDELFKEAIEEEIDSRKEAYLTYFRRVLSDSSIVKIEARYNEEEEKTYYSLTDIGDDSPYTSMAFSDDNRQITTLDAVNKERTIDLFAELVKTYLERGITYTWTKKTEEVLAEYRKQIGLDSTKLDTFFREKLNKYGINTAFNLIRLENDSIEVNEYNSKEVITNRQATNFAGDSDYMIARFSNPFQDILERIWFTLFASLIIVVLVSFCFFLLLNIIFKQKELARIKDDFIDNITHELQTPIAILAAANEGLTKYNILENKEKTKQYLNISKTEIQRLAKLVDNILLNSIYERESLALPLEEIDIVQLLEDVCQKSEVKFGAQIDISIHKNNPDIVLKSNRLHLRNVLDNLIENAVKYNDQSVAKVDLTILQLEEQTIIKVEDNGIGIPHKYQEKIFDKFFRVPEVSDLQIKGYGIGLYYVKDIVEQLGGTIDLDSSPEGGTTFEITLPR